MAEASLSQVVQEVTKEILVQIGLDAEIELSEKDNSLWLSLKAKNPGILIGYHGDNLNSLQYLLKMIVQKKTGEWPSLVVDVGDYRESREKVLQGMARGAAEKVRLSGQSFYLPPLPAYERRVVHLALKEESGVVSESEGEGRERRVVVKPQKES